MNPFNLDIIISTGGKFFLSTVIFELSFVS